MQLAGKLLIAMPGMGDPRFARSVVVICAHSPESAMGLIVNRPARELHFAGVIEHLGIGPRAGSGGERREGGGRETGRATACDADEGRGGEGVAREIRVHFGGPVERGRGFVLHSDDWAGNDPSMEVPGGLRLTGTLDILEALARGGGPERALFALGYAGWGPGQLEGEIARNDWLVADAPAGLVFAAPDDEKWMLAMRVLGIDPLMLSPVAGRA